MTAAVGATGLESVGGHLEIERQRTQHYPVQPRLGSGGTGDGRYQTTGSGHADERPDPRSGLATANGIVKISRPHGSFAAVDTTRDGGSYC